MFTWAMMAFMRSYASCGLSRSSRISRSILLMTRHSLTCARGRGRRGVGGAGGVQDGRAARAQRGARSRLFLPSLAQHRVRLYAHPLHSVHHHKRAVAAGVGGAWRKEGTLAWHKAEEGRRPSCCRAPQPRRGGDLAAKVYVARRVDKVEQVACMHKGHHAWAAAPPRPPARQPAAPPCPLVPLPAAPCTTADTTLTPPHAPLPRQAHPSPAPRPQGAGRCRRAPSRCAARAAMRWSWTSS